MKSVFLEANNAGKLATFFIILTNRLSVAYKAPIRPVSYVAFNSDEFNSIN